MLQFGVRTHVTIIDDNFLLFILSILHEKEKKGEYSLSHEQRGRRHPHTHIILLVYVVNDIIEVSLYNNCYKIHRLY